MNRYERVIEILDTSVGGPGATVGGPHHAFWRGKTRDQFIATKPLGRQLVTLGNGAGSTIVQALRGQGEFGLDTGNEDAIFPRMPAHKPAVPDADIAFIEQWINDNCPEDELPGAQIGTVEALLSGAASGDALLIVGQAGAPVSSSLTLRTTDGTAGTVTVRPVAPNATGLTVTPSDVQVSGTAVTVQVQATTGSAARNDAAVEIVQGARTVARVELTAIEHPRLRFAGRFQCRLATDPDPWDHPWGINASFGSFSVQGPDPSHTDEPPLDRIVRFSDPATLRPFCEPIGVSVTQIEADLGGIPTNFATGDALIGQPCNLGPKSVFDSRNGDFAPAGFEPMTDFEFHIGTAFSGTSAPSVPILDPSQPPGSTCPTADGVFNLDNTAGLPPGQTAWKPGDFGFPDPTWAQRSRNATTKKLADLNAQATTPDTPAARIRQRRIQEHQANLSGIRAPFRLLERYIGLIDRGITITGEKTGLLGYLASLSAIGFQGEFLDYDSDCHTGIVTGTLSAPPAPPAPGLAEAVPVDHGQPVPRSPEAFADED